MRKTNRTFMLCLSAAALCVMSAAETLMAQAPGVEIVRDKGEQFTMLVKKANKLREENALLSFRDAAEQLERASCDIKLPKPNRKRLSDRDIWRLSKAAHLRVGYHYLCGKCDKWHQKLAGGYFITKDGAVATCYHVVYKPKDAYEEGYLVAANNQGDLFPVVEVLAADKLTDTAIIRVKADKDKVTPLPLKVDTYPGDAVWCYSDPLGRSGYFSKGMINRFYVYKKKGSTEESSRIEVSTDWAPGSSGAAVLDECGNAVGHVSEISAVATRKRKPTAKMTGSGTNKVMKVTGMAPSPMMTFHCACRAADVRSLVKDGGK